MTIWWFLSAFAVCLLGLRFALDKARQSAFSKGFQEGYQEGIEKGRILADNWWIAQEFEIREAAVKIRNEERWP